MVCENCGEREAVIHLTQIQSGQVTTVHLCEPCAAERGVETGTSASKFPLNDFLATLGKGGPQEPAGEGADVACAACGATLKDFRQTGRLGCAACYVSFEPYLRDLLRRLHGSATHVGETYAAPGVVSPVAQSAERQLGALRDELQRAIAAEDFERAAELRDRIRVLE